MRRLRQIAVNCALVVVAGIGIAGCVDNDVDGRRYGYRDYPRNYGSYNGGYNRGYYDGRYDSRRDRRYSYDDNDNNKWKRGETWKDRRYEKKNRDDRPGNADRFNNKLCRNGIPGDAPAGC